MKIFFSVGEPSGDLHGANLIRALRTRRPEIECVGYGGPCMAAAGCDLHADLTALAVMWFARVLLNLHKFLHLASRADRFFRHHRPDAVVLIDYPGFNWWIARRAKAHGIPVFYYTPPQIWAWASWRVNKMRRFVDHVLCSLPFEEAWFRQRGCRATFVGHPYFDEVRHHALDQALVDELRGRPGPLVTILPGSRTQEVQHNLKWFLKTAAIVSARVPAARFAIACFKPAHAQFAHALTDPTGLPVQIFVRRTPELMAAATCCLAVSGSVSLELLYHAKPTVVHYWVSRSAHWVQGFFRHTRYITLVNLLHTRSPFGSQGSATDPAQPDSERVLYPEYLTWQDRSSPMAAQIIDWLTNAERREARVAELTALRARVAHGGASARAADYILGQLAARAVHVPQPHWRGHAPSESVSQPGVGSRQRTAERGQ